MGKATKLAYTKKLKDLISRRKKIDTDKAILTEEQIWENYKIQVLHDLPPKPHRLQQDQIAGLLSFDEDNYHCEEYNDLMKSITPIRTKFVETSDLEEKKNLAGEEISHWHNYMSVREKSLPEHYVMNSKTLAFLEECFERESERRNNTLRSDRIVDFHYKFAKVKKFDIFIHHRNMLQIMHPYWGYMSAIEGKFFTFEEVIKMYRQQLVSSYERSLGQTYLAGK
jgi:hypothetical protein